MPYLALFQHQWMRRLRAPRPRLFWLALLLGALLLAYAVIGAVFLGLGMELLVHHYRPGRDPVSVVNSSIPGFALGLLVLRFLVQRPPLQDVAPYLTLPLRRVHLARFSLMRSALSLHNALPLCFAVAFAANTLMPLWGSLGALLWLGGVVSLLVLLDVVNLLLRTVLGNHTGRFLLVAASVGGALALDAWYGPNVVMLTGWGYFTGLVAGTYPLLVGTVVAVAISAYLLTRYLSQRLLVQGRQTRALSPDLSFAPSTPVWNLFRLEVAMIMRHKRPRQFVFISLLFSTVYTVMVLKTTTPNLVIAVVLGFMASGMFALNYGPLMFGWEGSYFDGILSRPTALGHVVLSKLLVLQASCLALFVVALPFFLLWAPEYVDVHIALTLYNAGICVPFVLWMALGNREPIALERSSMFNYQGVSFKHMGWSLLLSLPPVVLALLDAPQLPVVVGAVGLGGIGLSLITLHPVTRRLTSLRYEMARAFRTTAH